MDFEQITLVFLDILEHFIRIFRMSLLQLFHFLLQFPILTHRDLIHHIKITLIMRLTIHKRTNATMSTLGKILISNSNPFILPLHLSSHLLDQLSS